MKPIQTNQTKKKEVKEQPTATVYTIDATNRSVGRVASEAAQALMGKKTPDFFRHKTAAVKVEIVNAQKLYIPKGKKESTWYRRYTGYPGGGRVETLGRVLETKGHSEVLRRAVSGMIPTNKLKKPRLKNLTISD